jgi:Osmosensitive K+ channel histidine kinase
MNPVRTRVAALTCGITGLIAVLHNGGQRRVELARCAKKNMADNDGAGGPTARPERGRLRIYLGSAAGVGKTYAMLSEGHRRAERGADVVVGFAEAHGRPQTSALLDGLEVVPRATLEYRGATFEEMDVDAVLARRPEIALVDEFAHTNVPGRATRSAGRTWRNCSTPGST